MIALALFGFSAASFAQATASATATATIIAPITITNLQDMNFGNAAVAGAGTVSLDPDGLRIPTGGITLPVVTGTVAAAAFAVTGEGNSTYSITLPSGNYTITRLTGSETMTVNNFVSSPSVVAGGTLSDGSQNITVGATLNVNSGQVPGVYTNATGFDVTVNYN